VPFAPGGGQDLAARTIGAKLAESLGQSVVIDNRPSANGIVASEIVARAAPDGHTLYIVSTPFVVAPSLARKLPFDPVRDFAPVTRVSTAPGVLIVNPNLGVRSVADLIKLAKAKPGTLTFGTAGVGAQSHLSAELFKMMAGVDMIHVPYKGSALATTAVLANEVTLSFTNPSNAIGHGKAGRLRLLAVTTAERSAVLPGVPTVAESGLPGYENAIRNGILLPGRTPAPLIARFNAEIRKALASPEVVQKLTAEGATPSTDEPAAYAQFLAVEIAKWAKVVKAAGMRPE
jgi:tripartite-type tricarboxylate transporter receptor subunit TctC